MRIGEVEDEEESDNTSILGKPKIKGKKAEVDGGYFTERKEMHLPVIANSERRGIMR